MDRKMKLRLDELTVDSFPTVESPTPDLGSVYARITSADCTGDCDSGTNPASWDADCTITCTTMGNMDGITCGVPNCYAPTGSGCGGGDTWNNPSCAPNNTCAGNTCDAAYSCVFSCAC